MFECSSILLGFNVNTAQTHHSDVHRPVVLFLTSLDYITFNHIVITHSTRQEDEKK